MLTKEDEAFIQWYHQNRHRKKKVITQLAIGFPLSVAIFAGVFLTLVTGWYQRAEMVVRTNSSTIIVILVALVAVVVFISIFSVRYKWEQHDQHYRELMVKKNQNTRK